MKLCPLFVLGIGLAGSFLVSTDAALGKSVGTINEESIVDGNEAAGESNPFSHSLRLSTHRYGLHGERLDNLFNPIKERSVKVKRQRLAPKIAVCKIKPLIRNHQC